MPKKWPIGKGWANGNYIVAKEIEAIRIMSYDHNLSIRPLLPQADYAGLQHRNVADILQVVARLINKNAHRHLPI